MKHPIPDAALDDRLGFVGTAGSGKSYNAMGRIERLLEKRARVACVDPLGVFWGLRLKPDGKADSGFYIPIFGGPHGDLPLTEHSGALIGETVAGMAESCIIDLSEIGTKAGERRFMLHFLTALYRKAKDEPLHLVIDEADMFAPQKLTDKDGEAAKLLGMMETVVRRGRIKGFIPWLITQRPAVIAKDVLSQVDGLVAFKLTSSQDRDALSAWVEGSADKEDWKTMRAALPAMERGQGIVWIPGRGIMETVSFPEKNTFDSSRTPKRGEKKSTAALKPLDLGSLKERLAKVDAETKANDPKALKAEVARLTRELAAKPTPTAKMTQPSRETAAQINSLRKALEAAMKFIIQINTEGFFKAAAEGVDKAAIENAIAEATQRATQLIERHIQRRDAEITKLKSESESVLKRMKALLEQDVSVSVDVQHNEPFTIREPGRARSTAQLPKANGQFSGPQHRVLRSLAMWKALGHENPSREMVAAASGYSPSSGGFNNLLGGLATAGAIGKPMPGHLSLLIDAETMTADEGREMLLGYLNRPQRKLVDALNGAGCISRDELGTATEYSPSSGGFNNLIGSLSTLGLIVKPQAGHVALADWAQELLA